MYSVFAVVRNPSDHSLFGVSSPIWACIIIVLGLLLHYIRELASLDAAAARGSAS